MMRRRSPLLLALVAALVWLALPAQARAEIAGEIVFLDGTATVQRGGAALVAAPGLALHEGDTVVTHFQSRLKAKMIDDALLTLGPLSRLTVDGYVYDKPGATGRAALALTRGAMKASTGYIATLADRPFKVKTPIGTIGIRGTEFFAGEYRGEFTVILLSGKGITLENEAGTVAILDIGHGTQLAVAATPVEGVPRDFLAAETAPLQDRLKDPLPPARLVPANRLQDILSKVDF